MPTSSPDKTSSVASLNTSSPLSPIRPISAAELKKLRNWTRQRDVESLQSWFTQNPGRLNLINPRQRIEIGSDLLRLASTSELHRSEDAAFDPTLFECLMFHGALTDQDKKGSLKSGMQSTLTFVITRDQEEIVDLLLKQGCDIEAQDPTYFSPLSTAAHCGALKSLKLLIARGADLDARDEDYHRTALMFSIDRHNLEITKELVKSGANPFLKDKDGNTALSIAKHCNATQIAQYLSEVMRAIQEKEELNRALQSSNPSQNAPKRKESGAPRL